MTFQVAPGTVYFIGAGPGAADLMTLRGHALIEAADLVLFADSLIDPVHMAAAKPAARVVGTSSLPLEEIVALMVESARAGDVVVRLQSGDPTIFGALHEQLHALAEADVPTVVVPGVSSVTASAASLGIELTAPGIAQTVILARASGRASPVPERESLRGLAAHGATLALFLSAGLIEDAVRELIEGGYAPETPRRSRSACRGPTNALCVARSWRCLRGCKRRRSPARRSSSLAPLSVRMRKRDPVYTTPRTRIAIGREHPRSEVWRRALCARKHNRQHDVRVRIQSGLNRRDLPSIRPAGTLTRQGA